MKGSYAGDTHMEIGRRALTEQRAVELQQIPPPHQGGYSDKDLFAQPKLVCEHLPYGKMHVGKVSVHT